MSSLCKAIEWQITNWQPSSFVMRESEYGPIKYLDWCKLEVKRLQQSNCDFVFAIKSRGGDIAIYKTYIGRNA